VKTNVKKQDPENMFNIPKPKEVKPEDLIKKKHDPEREKKQQNIIKLKKQLALKLWDHKKLEMK